MSITDEILRIKENVAEAYSAVEILGGTVPDGESKNLRNLSSSIQSIPIGGSGGGVPKGTIVIWSGSSDDIPTGWALCDGENGTPDLRDRFVLGAGEGYLVGDMGGEEEHTLTVEEMPEHSHALTVFTVSTTSGTAPHRGTGEPVTNNAAIQSAGGSQPHNNMPPYYALCYIMCIVESNENTGGSSVTDEEYQALLDRVTALEALPTIEEYTSSSWHVRKWSDGYLELSLIRGISITASQFSASGNVYICPSTIFTQLVYPVAFKEIYSKAITPVQGTSGFYVLSPGATQSYPLTRTDLIHIARPGAPSATATYTVSYHITGRWK